MNARTPLLVIAFAVVCTASCETTTGPSSPLAGVWRTLPLPSGSGIDLSLSVSGATVAGKGHEYRLQYLADSLTVFGRQHIGGAFTLTVNYASGAVATYTGQMVGADQLDGTWHPSPQTAYSLAFYRQ